jgi:hypothetical protein
MAKARYIIRLSDGELFGWNPDWLKLSGMIEYDPSVHGYRAEIAHTLGLEMPEMPRAVAPKVTVSEHKAGAVVIPTQVATEPKKAAQEQRTEKPDLSDVFAP